MTVIGDLHVAEVDKAARYRYDTATRSITWRSRGQWRSAVRSRPQAVQPLHRIRRLIVAGNKELSASVDNGTLHKMICRQRFAAAAEKPKGDVQSRELRKPGNGNPSAYPWQQRAGTTAGGCRLRTDDVIFPMK